MRVGGSERSERPQTARERTQRKTQLGTNWNAKHNWARIGTQAPKPQSPPSAPNPKPKAPNAKPQSPKPKAQKPRNYKSAKPPKKGGNTKKNTKNPPPKGASPPLDSPTNGALPLWIPRVARAGLPPIPRLSGKEEKLCAPRAGLPPIPRRKGIGKGKKNKKLQERQSGENYASAKPLTRKLTRTGWSSLRSLQPYPPLSAHTSLRATRYARWARSPRGGKGFIRKEKEKITSPIYNT